MHKYPGVVWLWDPYSSFGLGALAPSISGWSCFWGPWFSGGGCCLDKVWTSSVLPLP